MTDHLHQKQPTTEPASGIIEAIARLQEAFFDAGLMEPLAIIVRGEEQQRRLEEVFSRFLGYAAYRIADHWKERQFEA